MNPTATPLTQVQSAPNPSTTNRQQAAASSDVPFSQVLSGEIEHNRNSAEAREANRTEAAGAASSNASNAATASADPTETKTTSETQTSLSDLPQADASRAEVAALPPGAQALPVAPDALLALAMQFDLLRSAPAVNDGASAEPATDSDASPALLNGRKGSARPAWQTQQTADGTLGTGKADAELTGQVGVRTKYSNTASSSSVAATFAGQLATRQADAFKTGERLPDIPSTPSLSVQSQASVATAAPLPPGASTTLAPSVGTTAWSQALGDKIVWMAAGAQQTATLTLNPPNLGPLQIVINLTNDQATANFFTAQPEVRQALETAFPRLREMMSDAGIQLGQASVSAETPGQHAAPERQAQQSALPFTGMAETADLPAALGLTRESGRGLVDTFA